VSEKGSFFFFCPLSLSPLFSACCFEFGLDPSPPKTPERCQFQRLFNANVFIANAFFLFVLISSKKKIGFRIVSKIKYRYKKERKKVLMKEEDRAKETKKRKGRS
jgi:hypothetical protein